MAMPVWEGLARLDSVAKQLAGGTYVQPEYSFVKAVEVQPEATPAPNFQPTVGIPTWDEIKAYAQTKQLKPKTDYDALLATLGELKF